MNKIHEISRRISFRETTASACGPVSIASIDAEIAVQDGPETVYIFGEWVSEMCDEIRCMAVRESMFDVSEKFDNGAEDLDTLIAERERIEAGRIIDDEKYQNLCVEITDMIKKEMEDHGYKTEID